jgi:hypothetical protein
MSGIVSSLVVKIASDVSQFDKGMQGVNRKLDTFSKTAGNLGKTLIFAGLGAQAIGLGKEVINITAEFQKLKAVLTNTLGSKGAADLAFDQIRQFASSTPFAVQELTDSFVKLTNAGFKPTLAQMRSLGDLASSTGKSFSDVADATVAALTGQFERLKAFGVIARKEGDNVKFTFKGVTQEVKFTDEAIKGYITSLGEAQGVSGAMAAISETLTGKISNLGDKYDNLLDTIGRGNTGIIAGAIDQLGNLLDVITYGFSDISDRSKEFVNTESIQAGIDNLKKLKGALADLQEQQKNEGFFSKLGEKITGRDDEANKIQLISEAIRQQQKAINELVSEEQKGRQVAKQKAVDDAEAAKRALEELGLIGRLKKELKEVTELRDSSNSLATIETANVRIKVLSEEIKRLQDLRREYDLVANVKGIGFKDIGADLSKTVVSSASLKDIIEFQKQMELITRQQQVFGEAFDEGAARISAYTAEINRLLEEGYDPMSPRIQQLRVELEGLSQTVEEQATALIDMTPLFYGFAESIGDAFSNIGNGSTGLDNFFTGVLGTVADFAGNFGKQLIALGVAKTGLDKLFASVGGGPAAIAAGIALMALSKVVSNSIKGGPFSGGGGVGSSGPGPGARIKQGGDPLQEVRFRIQGNDLMGLIQKQSNINSRLGGTSLAFQ